MKLRDYLRQARAAEVVGQVRHRAMLPFAAHAVDDEMVFGSDEAYRTAVAAADVAEAEWRGANAGTGGQPETPPVPKS